MMSSPATETAKRRRTAPRTSFADRVRAVVAAIPAGTTLSYSEVARRAGHPNAARAVGRILNANTDPAIPCHRVVKSDGSIGGYNQGEEEKRLKLEQEKRKI